MRMSAHYCAYAQDDIEAIKNSGDGEALDEYDLDKMWDAMHKTLMGKNMFEAMSTGEIFTTPNPLSWAIFGRGMAGEEGSEAVSYVDADDVKAVAKAMQSTDIGVLLASVNFTGFGEAGTYSELLSKCREQRSWRTDRDSVISKFYRKPAKRSVSFGAVLRGKFKPDT